MPRDGELFLRLSQPHDDRVRLVEVRRRVLLHLLDPPSDARKFTRVHVVTGGDRLHHFTHAEQIRRGQLISGDVSRPFQPERFQIAGRVFPLLMPFLHGFLVHWPVLRARNDDLDERFFSSFSNNSLLCSGRPSSRSRAGSGVANG